MAKTDMTKQLEISIWRTTNKMGVFGCHEVTIGWYGKQRVDYMTYDTKGIFRCYEIKVSKADFHSKNGHNFVGHYNYYVMPSELYEQVKEEIPPEIGVYVPFGGYCESVKRAKRVEVEDADILKDSMIRSLCRYSTEQMQSESEPLIKSYKRRLAQSERQRQEYYRKYWDLKTKTDPRYDRRVPLEDDVTC